MPTPGAPDPDLVFLLQQASHALETEMAVKLAELGITPRWYCVLTKAMPGDRTQSQIAELSALDKTTMVVTVDELEKAGLAERKPSATDRRARIVAVTEKGARIVADAHRIVTGIYEDVLASAPGGTREPFVTALTGLVGDRLSTPPHTERPIRRHARRAT
ncbi:MarR family winged helix-turn-helix transcriptional regulator [Amycolatopsis anabasis]|uniref:MarR family winged helix-turn-helix transcriptional regulator n=1 Tax=Amycolatopsis anabasis TaxID=1840409 RepID=UPI00131D4D27|nr:MarR family transcriptional regulator [Amycolatopsis anabasis]